MSQNTIREVFLWAGLAGLVSFCMWVEKKLKEHGF